jgi:hypothetical protein
MTKGRAKMQSSAQGKIEDEIQKSDGPQLLESEPADSADRIRDILFGGQMRQYDQRFSNLEKAIKNEVSNLREETRKALESLENYTKKEFESLASRLKSEQNEHTESIDELSNNFDNKSRSLEKKLSQLDENTLRGQGELQKQLLNQSKDLMEEIRTTYERCNTTLDQSVKDLRNHKADRIALANLFTEVAMRLKEEFEIVDVT